MSLAELLPAIHALPRADKLKLLEHLASDVAREEEASRVAEPEAPIWSPHDEFVAAHALLQVLEESRSGM